MSLPVALTGDPDHVRSRARLLAGLATELAAVERVVRGVQVHAVWRSPAGEAFARHLNGLPGVLTAAAERCNGGAAGLSRFAAELADCLDRSRAAVEDIDEATERLRLLDIALDRARAEAATLTAAAVGTGPADPGAATAVAALERQRLAAVEDLLAAERRLELAEEDFHVADQRCASAIYALAGDRLDDPAGYDALHVLRDVAGGVEGGAALASFVPGLGAPMTVLSGTAAVGGLAADTGIRVGYGEGSWSEVASRAAWGAALPLATTLRFAGKAGSVAGRWTHGPAENLMAGTRLRRGLAEQWARSAYNPGRVPQVAPPRAPARSPLEAVLRAVRNPPERRLVRESVEDWALVTRSGSADRLLVAGGISLRAADLVHRRVETGRHVLDRARGRTGRRPEQDPQRPQGSSPGG